MKTLAQVQNWADRFGVNVDRKGREYEVWTTGAMTDVSSRLSDAIQAVHEFISQENLHIQIRSNDIFRRQANNPTEFDPYCLLFAMFIVDGWLHLNHVNAWTLPGEEYVKVRIDEVTWISPTCFRYHGECYQWLQMKSKIKRVVGYTVSF